MSLSVDIRHRLGRFQLAVRFESAGHVTALFGRSGAGKTSLVNIIAGLVRPDAGRVSVAGEVLVDTARGLFVPPHKRRVGYVFQEARLFPHLTTRQNLLYGHWFAPRHQRYAQVDDVVELLGIGHLLDRRPALLSGGEKQRVAVGRALLASPRMLLMDEPLAALDEQRKAEILPYLERLRDHARIPIVYVSHSLPEVTRLATTMVILSDGQVAAIGPTQEVMARVDLFPLTGRGEAGALIDVTVQAHDDRYGLTVLAHAAGRLHAPRIGLPVGSAVRLRVRARDVMVGLKPPEALSALNVLPATVAEIGPTADGPIVDVRLDCAGQSLLARLTRKSIEGLALVPGRPCYAVIKAVAFDRRTMAGAVPDEDAEPPEISAGRATSV